MGRCIVRLRLLADQAFARTAGAPLIEGNAVRLLKDGCENYPAWLEAIAAAQHWIHFETYILHDDKIGQVFADALVANGACRRQGAPADRLARHMLKTLAGNSGGRLRQAGVEARSFGYPHASIRRSAGSRAITANR